MPELAAPNRYFLTSRGGGFSERIFAVARWIDAGVTDSVVLVFVNLNPHEGQAAWFQIPDAIRLAGTYQVVNLVANDPAAHLWPSPQSTQDLRANGIFVQFSLPNEVQYLRLVSV